MADFQHKVTRKVATASGALSRPVTLFGSGDHSCNRAISTGVVDEPIYFPVDVASLVDFYLASDQDVTIETDGGDSIAIKAGVAYQWDEDSDNPLFFTLSTSAWFMTNASGSTANVFIRVLNDTGTAPADDLSGVADFTPDDIEGLAMWFETGDVRNIHVHEATGLGNPCEDGEACLGWEDLSGNAKHLTEATNGPTAQFPNTGESATPNGKIRLECDGSNDLLTGASAADWKNLHDGTGMTALVVCQTEDEENCPIFDTSNKLAGIGAVVYNDDSSTTEGRLSFCVRNGSGNIFNMQAPTGANVFPVASWHCASARYVDGTDPDLWADGCFIVSATPSGSPSSSNPAIALKIGPDFSSGFVANKYAAMLIYNRRLTDAEMRKATVYLSRQYGFPVGNVACIGDSITAGYSGITTPYPTRLAQILGSLWRVTNFGVSGAVVNESGGADDLYNDQWLATNTGARRRRYNFAVCMGGINDIRNTSDSAATIFARYDDLLDSVRAEPGCKLIVCTCIPFKNDSAWSSGKQAVLESYNQLIRDYAAAHSDDTYLVDLYPIMGDDADEDLIAEDYNLDNLHPNQVGADAIAAAVGAKLQAIGLLL